MSDSSVVPVLGGLNGLSVWVKILNFAHPKFFLQPADPVLPRPGGPDLHSEHENCIGYYSPGSKGPMGKDSVSYELILTHGSSLRSLAHLGTLVG